MNYLTGRLWFASLLLLSLPVLAQNNLPQLSPKQLAQPYKYHDVDISPDGKHLAVVLTQDDERKLIVLDVATSKIVGTAVFSGKEQVGNAFWVNEERLVVSVVYKNAWDPMPFSTGEFYGVNFDGSHSRIIFGLRARRRSWSGASVVDYLPSDKRHILISRPILHTGKGRRSEVRKLNVYNGWLSAPLASSPIGYADFVTDQQGKVRLVSGIDDEYKRRVYSFDAEEDDWEEIPVSKFGGGFKALRFDESGEWLYILDNLGQDKRGLSKWNLTTGERKGIYTDKEVDITSPVFNASKNAVYAVRIDPGYPAYVVFNHESEESKTFKALVQAFPSNRVMITSQSDDGNKLVISVSSDSMPSAFYLYDKQSNRLSMLFNNLGDLNPNLLSTSEPIAFASRDGVQIHGYLSRPVNVKSEEKVPLVVLIHGGPHDVRDFWIYDREVQLLTSQGYAVLRVNFRGSGGFGLNHQESGYKHWGDLIQHDIIDGTKWAIEHQNIEADKVCIMGASFGGYSALQSAVLEPDLFKCVVTNAGVYDLELMLEEDIILEQGWGDSYMEMALGKDKQKIKQFSPVNQVGRLKADIMIAHGKKDRILPIEHAEKLAEKLDKVGKKYHWFVRSTEGHGFVGEENRAEYYKEVADFLKEHLH